MFEKATSQTLGGGQIWAKNKESFQAVVRRKESLFKPVVHLRCCCGRRPGCWGSLVYAVEPPGKVTPNLIE